MASVVPQVIDWLVTEIRALDECENIPVSDGWPDQVADTYVAIGVVPEGQEVNADAEFAQLGGGMEEEQSFVPCFISSWCGGDGESGAQKTARDACFAILTAVQALIRAHLDLDEILNSGAAQVSSYPLQQARTAGEAGQGRRAEIFFVVRFSSRF